MLVSHKPLWNKQDMYYLPNFVALKTESQEMTSDLVQMVQLQLLLSPDESYPHVVSVTSPCILTSFQNQLQWQL